MAYKVFVDGQEGTTGLKIHERLGNRNDIEIIKIDADKRKDINERSKLINQADIVFLCLPDAAAKESVSLVKNPDTRVIDASTAHRTDSNWTYGLPELSASNRNAIKTSKRVSNPGCYATCFNLLVFPLVKEGIVQKDYPVSCHAVSGYSGAGRKMIEQYQSGDLCEKRLDCPRFYSLGLNHKHLPEMQKTCGLDFEPIFSPIINNYYQGMVLAIPLHIRLLKKRIGVSDIQKFMSEYYNGQKFVSVIPFENENFLDNGFLPATNCNNTNKAELFIFGNDERVLLAARLDNLGKGASGAAIQNMNIMLGIDEATGL